MKNIEMLAIGIEEIAKNHGFEFNTDYEDEAQMYICGNNVPTLGDVQMLCEDTNFPWEDVESHDYGIDLFISEEWYEEYGKKKYKKTPYGEMWRRRV